MSTTLTIPKLEMSMSEGTLAEWVALNRLTDVSRSLLTRIRLNL